MKKKILHAVFLLAVLSMTGCYSRNQSTDNSGETHAATSNSEEHKHSLMKSDEAKYFSATITVKGAVHHPLNLSVDSLKKMRTAALDSFNVVCQSGATTSKNIKSRGVLLKDILEKASIIQTNHKDRNFYIVARASDGYKATFSWAEIFNNPTGENTYVIFEENGQPIKDKGAMILNCTNDIKTGPRHVIWLNSIEVNKVE